MARQTKTFVPALGLDGAREKSRSPLPRTELATSPEIRRSGCWTDR